MADNCGMNLQRAQYLVALADHLSFTRTAAALHMSQSALSQQIQVFERELGVTLIDRAGPRIGLTDAGRTAVREARFLLRAAERATERIRAAAAGGGGQLRIAHTRSWSGGAVAAALDQFRERHPDVVILEQRSFTSRNVELVVSAAVDIAVVRPPVEDPELAVRLVDREQLLIAVPTAHPFAATESVRRERLADEPVVFWPRENGPGMYDAIVAQLWPEHPPHVVRHEADDEQMLRAVAAGVGIAPVPAGRATVLQVPGVRLCRVDGPAPVVTLGLAFRPDNPNPNIERFLRLPALGADVS